VGAQVAMTKHRHDEEIARRLAWRLTVEPVDAANVDRRIDDWVEAYIRAVEPPYRLDRELPGLHDTVADASLASLLCSLEPPATLYAWAHLWLVHDSMFSRFRLPITGPRLDRHIELVVPDRLSAEQALALADLFQHSGMDQNLDDELWRLCAASGLLRARSVAEDRDALLQFFLTCAAMRLDFSYRKVARVLRALQIPDHSTQERLRIFGSGSQRAAAEFVSVAYREIGLDSTRPRPGESVRAAIAWFASARARAPTDKWKDERTRLESVLQPHGLKSLATWIRRRPTGRYFGEKPYRDDLFFLLWKSASWYLELDPSVPSG